MTSILLATTAEAKKTVVAVTSKPAPKVVSSAPAKTKATASPAKSAQPSTKIQAAPAKPAPAAAKKAAPNRREELLKQLKAVEDAIAKKRTK